MPPYMGSFYITSHIIFGTLADLEITDINLPLDGLAFFLLLIFLKLETPKTPLLAGLKSIDWVGVLLIIGGVVMFLFGMESGGQTQPWASAYTICLIVFGVFTIALFFINEWKFAKYPIMPLRLFRETSNLASLGVCFCHGFVFIAGSYVSLLRTNIRDGWFHFRR